VIISDPFWPLLLGDLAEVPPEPMEPGIHSIREASTPRGTLRRGSIRLVGNPDARRSDPDDRCPAAIGGRCVGDLAGVVDTDCLGGRDWSLRSEDNSADCARDRALLAADR
jgi:hypothetical protein